jgi:hypothetical protein
MAEIADMAVRVAKAEPCSSAINITMGPATTGKALNKPAIPDPHLRPAKVIRNINSGTIVSLSISSTD